MADEREQQIREPLGHQLLAKVARERDEAIRDAHRLAMQRDAAFADLAAAREENRTLRELLAEWIDDEAGAECRPGRHGDCEVHLYAGPCIVGRTRTALAREDGGNAG